MAPKNKRGGSTATDNQENDVTVTDEATTEATPAAEAAPAKEVIDHEGNLYGAIVAFASDSDVAKLQASYREVPAAARGKVQGVAMKRAMTEGGLDIEVIGTVLDAFNNLPSVTKSRTAKPELDPTTAGAIRLYGLMAAYESLRTELGDDAHNLAQRWFNDNEIPADAKAQVDKVVESVAKASAARGAGGPRTVLKQTFAELVTAGTIPVGATLKGANGAEAEVTADGKIVTLGATYDAPSPAAKAHRTQDDGKKTSTNGWDFWTLDGKSIGGLRTF